MNPQLSSRVIQLILDKLIFDGTVHDVRIGLHWTVVVVQAQDGLRAGLAATEFRAGIEHGAPSVRAAGHLIGKLGTDLAALALSECPVERSLGLAAINALLDVPPHACVDENAEERILQKGAAKSVAIVGHFPFVGRVRQAAKVSWILELVPGAGDVPASYAPELIPLADVVVITGMTLLNGTFDGLIQLCRPDAYVLVLGPSTPLSPVLFECGVDALSGTRVIDIPAVVMGVSQGATFRQLTGRRLVTVESSRWHLPESETNKGRSELASALVGPSP